MSRDLFKSMTYKKNKVYTRASSNNVYPKYFIARENKMLTEKYQNLGEKNFEKWFLNNCLIEGNVEILNDCNKVLKKLDAIYNSLSNDNKFIQLKNNEHSTWEDSVLQETKSIDEYKEAKHRREEYVNSFYNIYEMQSKEGYKDYKSYFILTDATNTIIYANHIDDLISIVDNEITSVFDWDYNIDTYLFEELEKGKVILEMSDEAHCDIWYGIENLYPHDIEHKVGLEKYIHYCQEQGITKEYICSKFNVNVEDITKILNLTYNNQIPYDAEKEPAKTLPYGWNWICYSDGSGYLESPDDRMYASYDMATREYQIKGKETQFYPDEYTPQEWIEKLIGGKDLTNFSNIISRENTVIDDKEKINDLLRMNREDFLKSYSYLSVDDYDNTINYIENNIDNLYLSFSIDGRHCVTFDLKNSFTREIHSTLELLSYENKCDIKDIKISLIDEEEYKKLLKNIEKEQNISHPIFDRNDDTFKYTGSYSDYTMEKANELSDTIFLVGEGTYELVKSGKIKSKEALEELLNFGSVIEENEIIKVYSSGFNSIRKNKILRDDLFNTKASEKLYKQMDNWLDKCMNKLSKNKEESYELQ